MPPIVARPSALIELAEREVLSGFNPRLLRSPGVNLYRLAAGRRIHTVGFRPLLADGCLVVDPKVFSVQINDDRPAVVTVGQSSDDHELTTRQRFSLAHEIAHTLPYDLTQSPPRLKNDAVARIAEAGGRETAQSVEMFCQVAAGFILIPPNTLRHSQALGPWETVDSVDTVLRLARTFRVSPEVLIHRIMNSNPTEEVTAYYFALIFVRTVRKEEQIRAYIYSPTLTGIADAPKLYSKAKTWVARTPTLKSWDVLTVAEGQWQRPVGDGSFRVVKRPYGRDSGSYFLELKYSPA